MTTVQDSTMAARVPLDLRRDAEAVRDLLVERGVTYPDGRPADLSLVLRTGLREFVDRELGRAPSATGGLFSPRGMGASRGRDPDTSKAAASKVAPRVGSQRHRALVIIAAAGEVGATADDVIRNVERELGRRVAVNGYARRVTDLLQAGAIEAKRDPTVDPAGGHWHYGYPVVTRPTRNGADATVFVVTDQGRAWLREVREDVAA